MWYSQYLTKRQDHTHLLLSGGKLFVTQQDHGTFLNQYANAVLRKENLYVVETKTPVFRLFVDFDFQPPPEDLSDIQAAAQTVASISGYYFDTESDAVVLRKTKDSPEKIGVHMTWDGIFVTAHIARAFRNHVVGRLETLCPEICWKTVVDESVYGGSGLRMPWSQKRTNASVYVPFQILNQKGDVSPVSPDSLTDVRSWIRRTSIRTPDQSPTKTCIEVTVPEDQRTPGHSVSHESLEEYKDVLEDIQKILPPAYKDQRFTGMHRYSENCVVLRSSSQRCGNKDFQPHASSTIYFVLLKHKGVGYQRCYSRKDAVRQGGVACVDYSGDPFTLSESIIQKLWPDNTKREMINKRLLQMLQSTRPSKKKTSRQRKK